MAVRARHFAFVLVLAAAPAVGAQTPAGNPLPGSPITNEGVPRADSIVDGVFLSRRVPIDTVDVGDFTGYLLARLDVKRLRDSLQFRVTADSQRIRISGRLMDFPPEARGELGPIFSFLDSTSVFVAEVSMPRGDSGVMRFHLERVTVRGFPIPDLLLMPALAEYNRRYPVLASSGRDFLVAMPPEATARLVTDGIELRMPPPAPSAKATTKAVAKPTGRATAARKGASSPPARRP